MEAPLVILGHPGSGKSLLTKILAARLPPQDFLSVRVELRDVPADSDLQYQIESTFLKETGERVVWPEFAETAGDVLLVIIFDGLDDMLQTTGMHYWDYIERKYSEVL